MNTNKDNIETDGVVVRVKDIDKAIRDKQDGINALFNSATN